MENMLQEVEAGEGGAVEEGPRVPVLAKLEGWFAPRWTRLTEMGNSRILRSSYLWFFLVPPLANLLSKLGAAHTISLFGATWTLHLGLPFSWKVFYFAAAAFAVATTIFFLRCPEIVRRYRNFSEFTAEGKGARQVRDYFLDFLARRRLDSIACLLVTGYLTDFTEEHEGFLAPSSQEVDGKGDLMGLVIEATLRRDMVADAFWYVRSIADRANPFSAILCGMFFLVGFLLVAVVLCQNFIYVWNLTFPVR